MDAHQRLRFQIAGLCGLLSAIILFISLSMSISLAPWFSWTGNWLSDLGGSLGQTPLWAARGISSVFFNSGLIIAGLIGILFSIALRKSWLFRTSLGNASTLLLSVNMVALCGIGLFPVPLGKLHVVSSLTFFCSIPVFLFLISFEVRRLFGNVWWRIIHLLCIVSLCFVGSFLFLPHLSAFSKAIAEMVLLLAIFSFCIALSIRTLIMSMSRNKKEKHRMFHRFVIVKHSV